MKRIKVIALLGLVIGFLIPVNAQETVRKYAELLGYQKGLFSEKVTVSVDLGQSVSMWKRNDRKIVDENGKDIVFNTMIDAMNYMGERGWKFEQAYVVTEGNQNVYHWLLYKDLLPGQEITEGIRTRQMAKAESVAKAPKLTYKFTFMKRQIDGGAWEKVKEEVYENITERDAEQIKKRWKNKAGGQWQHDCIVLVQINDDVSSNDNGSQSNE